MTEDKNLQDLFSSFSVGLQDYIKQEVKRQVQIAVSSKVKEKKSAVVDNNNSDSTMVVPSSSSLNDDFSRDNDDSVSVNDDLNKSENVSYNPGFSGLKDLLAKVTNK